MPLKSTRAYGLRHAAQPLHRTGSYGTTGMSGRCFRGVTSAPKGTTHFVASILLFGQTFLRADRAKGSRSDSTVRGRNARAARRDVRAMTPRGGHERGGRRDRGSADAPRSIGEKPTYHDRRIPSTASRAPQSGVCMPPSFLALACERQPRGSVLPAATRVSYAPTPRSSAIGGARGSSDLPPGVSVEGARAGLCRGGRGTTAH